MRVHRQPAPCQSARTRVPSHATSRQRSETLVCRIVLAIIRCLASGRTASTPCHKNFEKPTSSSYQLIVLRHVVDLAHEKLQSKLQVDKLQDETWKTYGHRLNFAHREFFAPHGLDNNLSLLYRGYETAHEAGNEEAACRPTANTVVDRVVAAKAEDDGAWLAVWKFASTD